MPVFVLEIFFVFAGPYPTVRIQNAIATPQNFVATSRRVLSDEISMTPNSRKDVKVCFSIDLFAIFPPEGYRHREEWLGDHHFTLFSGTLNILTFLIPYFHLHSQLGGGYFARIYAGERMASHNYQD